MSKATSYYPMQFPTNYPDIINRLENTEPLKYARTRNFIDGDVTYLSPYISRGVISLRQVASQVLKNYKAYQVQKFLQELAWREYWQRTWQSLGDKIFTDLKQQQQNVAHYKMVTAIENAATGIAAIDRYIQLLYQTGYMHNHLRMYVSSIACNIANAHWWQPSAWMYYHLLDGDLANNSLSWQWTTGTFSSKKYYCNQENINRYTNSQQQNTFLDYPYEQLTGNVIPQVLKDVSDFKKETTLPVTATPVIEDGKPVLVYNAYNLDPAWHNGEACNRILLIEPSHYRQHPVSKKVMQFIIDLSANIKGIQLYTAEFTDLKKLAASNEIIYKSHPAYTYYDGTGEAYDDLFPEVTGYFPSFFKYWKKCEQYLTGY